MTHKELILLINKIKIKSEILFHILKHFNTVDYQFKKILLSKGYSTDNLNNQMTIPASKFLKNFAANPYEVLNRVKQNTPSDICVNNNSESGKTEITIIFSNKDFKDGIGFDRVININKLNKNQIKNLKQIKSESHTITTIKGNPVKTLKLNIITEQINNNINLITLFPGQHAPPLPDKHHQSLKNFIISKNYWDKHVFIDPK